MDCDAGTLPVRHRRRSTEAGPLDRPAGGAQFVPALLHEGHAAGTMSGAVTKRGRTGPFFVWRREWDSNPRWALDPYTLSRRAPSTARPSLLIRSHTSGIARISPHGDLLVPPLRFGTAVATLRRPSRQSPGLSLVEPTMGFRPIHTRAVPDCRTRRRRAPSTARPSLLTKSRIISVGRNEKGPRQAAGLQAASVRNVSEPSFPPCRRAGSDTERARRTPALPCWALASACSPRES